MSFTPIMERFKEIGGNPGFGADRWQVPSAAPTWTRAMDSALIYPPSGGDVFATSNERTVTRKPSVETFTSTDGAPPITGEDNPNFVYERLLSEAYVTAQSTFKSERQEIVSWDGTWAYVSFGPTLPSVTGGCMDHKTPVSNRSVVFAIPVSGDESDKAVERGASLVFGFNALSDDPNARGIYVEVPNRNSLDTRVMLRVGTSVKPFPGLVLPPRRTVESGARRFPSGVLVKVDVTPVGLRATAWTYRIDGDASTDQMIGWDNPGNSSAKPVIISGPHVIEHTGIVPDGTWMHHLALTNGHLDHRAQFDPYPPGGTQHLATASGGFITTSIDLYDADWAFAPFGNQPPKKRRWAQRDDRQWGGGTSFDQGFKWGGGSGYL